MLKADYARWNRPVFRYDSPDSFAGTPDLPGGIHAINCNGIPIDLLISRKSSQTLLVVFGGAVRRQDTTPPFFSGLGVSRELNASLLCVSDPSYYLDGDLAIGWYAGCRQLMFQCIFPPLLNTVSSLIANRVILLGGSAGGFASLYFAQKSSVPAIAVTLNPQIVITNYSLGHVQHFARVCFGWQEGTNLESHLARHVQFDVGALYSGPVRAPVLYLQNRSDSHVTRHAIPFLKNYGLQWTGQDQSAEGLYLHVGDWGKGHMPPPRPLLNRILGFLCNHSGGWTSALAPAEMRHVLAEVKSSLLQPA